MTYLLDLIHSSKGGHKATTVSFHFSLSFAVDFFSSFQVLPIVFSSVCSPLLQVFFGLLCFRWPWGSILMPVFWYLCPLFSGCDLPTSVFCFLLYVKWLLLIKIINTTYMLENNHKYDHLPTPCEKVKVRSSWNLNLCNTPKTINTGRK